MTSQPHSLRAALASALVVIAMAGTVRAATPEEEAKAAELFAQSAGLYRDGRFEEAIALLTKAYGLVGEPVLLYNLARAYEGHGDLLEAVDAYRRYLDLSEDVNDRGAIERRIRTLEAQLAEREALARDAQAARRRAAEAEAEREQPSASPYPWIVAGTGAATLVVSGVLGALAKSRESEADEEPGQIPASETLDEAETFATATNVTLAVGGALVLGGVAWGVADLLLLDGDDGVARLRLGPTHATLGVTFP